ncbi:MAG TPA: L,D-transpeptidase family protein [Rubricoccaceae bacterium]|nr:L,D-transpeptidase family protein [Rubricoccaceae bacterium]
MRRLLPLVFLAALPAAAQPQMAPLVIPPETRQLVVVVTPGWEATAGTLRRFEREGAAWAEVGEPIPAVVGRSGLGWGRGLHPEGLDGPPKREGDGRAPAGVFYLTEAFGYAEDAETGLPYRHATDDLECVDDPASAHYNDVLDRTTVAPDWASHEEMRRRDDLYRLGVVVAHNRPAEPGAGSCIFLHVWAGPRSTTSGCTAMQGAAMDALAAWLDADAAPVLVQLPEAEYVRWQAAWDLP